MALQALPYLLVLHLIGLTIMAGTTLVDFVTFRQFWALYAQNKQKALPVMEVQAKFPRLLATGIILLLVTGISMMAVTRGVFGEQLWFRIKMVIVVLVIINGLAVGRRQAMKLRRLITTDTGDSDTQQKVKSLRQGIAIFHISQLLLFIVIIILSTFRFN